METSSKFLSGFQTMPRWRTTVQHHFTNRETESQGGGDCQCQGQEVNPAQISFVVTGHQNGVLVLPYAQAGYKKNLNASAGPQEESVVGGRVRVWSINGKSSRGDSKTNNENKKAVASLG